jgi:ABC-type antimicrobial peptide transport system permease subunit
MSRRWQQVRHQLRRNRPAQFSLFVLFIFVIAALCAGLSPYDPDQMALGARTYPRMPRTGLAPTNTGVTTSPARCTAGRYH